MFSFKVSVSVFSKSNHRFIFKRFSSSKVRVRFAPSPTGFLHLGGLRTALYNDFFAKSHNGVNILRIEDTDLIRKVPEAVESLIEDLSWCGIKFDEGPYFQSERKDIYIKYVEQLVEQGHAYYCFCTSVRLDLIRREALKLGQIPKYDNHCRLLSKEDVAELKKEKPHCIRLKLNNFNEAFNDLICGSTCHDVAAVEGDPVIVKTDGYPTYHFANVVDDYLMGITHVLRGVEWLTSTPKHILLYRAFNWEPPQFAHIPLLLNENGLKLSKRQGDITVKHLRENGFSPTSLVNFVVRFGGGFDFSPEESMKIFSYGDLIEKFDLLKVKSASGKVNLELLSQFRHNEIFHRIETESENPAIVKEVQELVRNHFKNSEIEDKLKLDYERVLLILKTLKGRIKALKDIISKDFYYLWYWEKKWGEDEQKFNVIIGDLCECLKSEEWTEDNLKEVLKKFCKRYTDFRYSHVMQMIRFALTGEKMGHGVAEIMCSLSREEILYRLSKTIEPEQKKVVNQEN